MDGQIAFQSLIEPTSLTNRYIFKCHWSTLLNLRLKVNGQCAGWEIMMSHLVAQQGLYMSWLVTPDFLSHLAIPPPALGKYPELHLVLIWAYTIRFYIFKWWIWYLWVTDACGMNQFCCCCTVRYVSIFVTLLVSQLPTIQSKYNTNVSSKKVMECYHKQTGK